MVVAKGASPRRFLGLAGLVVTLASSAQAAAPTGRYVVNSGVVTDTQTGLIWQQGTQASLVSFSVAQQLCADLVLGGSSEWRCPSMKELQTLVDWAATKAPYIDTTAFPATASNRYWTSSKVSATQGMFVGFDSVAQNVGFLDVSTTLWVRCVR